MVSGFDRYFQIARCFRDEDLRADRQPEFTQIDIEASFVSAEDIYTLAEGLIAALWAEAGVAIPTPFPRMKYADAMERYGTDRPDLRYGLEIFDATDVFRGVGLRRSRRSAIEGGGRVRGIRIPGGAALSRKQVDELEALAKGAGAAGLLRLKREKGELDGTAGEVPVGGAGRERSASAGGRAVPARRRAGRSLVARRSIACGRRSRGVMQLVPAKTLELPVGARLSAVREGPGDRARSARCIIPFTAPHPDDLALLDTAPEKARALAYDVVLNGTELGGGSIRIADPDVQRRMFNLLGIDDADGAAALRIPARGASLRRAAARRHRVRLRPHRHAARRARRRCAMSSRSRRPPRRARCSKARQRTCRPLT